MYRRDFLRTGALAGFALAIERERVLVAKPGFKTNPFSLGIASGDPTSDAVILWTRLAPEPTLADGGMEPVGVTVRWQLASDDRMKRILQEGSAIARPELAHSVHVDVQGLAPSREYWYRFIVDGIDSPIGRTKTLPGLEEGPTGAREVRFVTCSCQHYEQGYFTAYDWIRDELPDFVLHLGDYIYDVSFGPGVRRHETDTNPRTLADYRRRHAHYKTDKALQRAHQTLPFIVVPDNHDALEFNDPRQYGRRAAAFQAWYEHLPIRARFRTDSAALSIYRSVELAEIASVHLLDTRQFRDDQMICAAEEDPAFGFGIYRPLCLGIDAHERSLLGWEQESWLERRMQSSRDRWNVFATTVPFADFEIDRGGVPHVYYGSWSAYPRNRERLVQSIEESGLHDCVFLSGDIHSSWVSEVAGRQPDTLIGKEFTTSSISSDWPEPLAKPLLESLELNPHVKLYEPTRRGFALHTVSRDRWTTRFQTLSSVAQQDPDRIEMGPFEIERTH